MTDSQPYFLTMPGDWLFPRALIPPDFLDPADLDDLAVFRDFWHDCPGQLATQRRKLLEIMLTVWSLNHYTAGPRGCGRSTADLLQSIGISEQRDVDVTFVTGRADPGYMADLLLWLVQTLEIPLLSTRFDRRSCVFPWRRRLTVGVNLRRGSADFFCFDHSIPVHDRVPAMLARQLQIPAQLASD